MQGDVALEYRYEVRTTKYEKQWQGTGAITNYKLQITNYSPHNSTPYKTFSYLILKYFHQSATFWTFGSLPIVLNYAYVP